MKMMERVREYFSQVFVNFSSNIQIHISVKYFQEKIIEKIIFCPQSSNLETSSEKSPRAILNLPYSGLTMIVIHIN